MVEFYDSLRPEARVLVLWALVIFVFTLPLLWPLYTALIDAILLPFRLIGYLLEGVERWDYHREDQAQPKGPAPMAGAPLPEPAPTAD